MGTYTTNKNLFMPTVGEQGWGDLVNGNFTTIDTFLKPITVSGSTYTFTGSHVGNQSGGSISATSITNSGTLTQTGTSTFTGKITANGGIGTTSLTTSSTITSTGKITANGGLDTKALTATSISNSGNMTNTGTLTSTGKIYANGGIEGNQVGNVTGNVHGYLYVPMKSGASGDVELYSGSSGNLSFGDGGSVSWTMQAFDVPAQGTKSFGVGIKNGEFFEGGEMTVTVSVYMSSSSYTASGILYCNGVLFGSVYSSTREFNGTFTAKNVGITNVITYENTNTRRDGTISISAKSYLVEG